MFFHRKELIQQVKVGKPDARFGTFLLGAVRRRNRRAHCGAAILGAVLPR